MAINFSERIAVLRARNAEGTPTWESGRIAERHLGWIERVLALPVDRVPKYSCLYCDAANESSHCTNCGRDGCMAMCARLEEELKMGCAEHLHYLNRKRSRDLKARASS